MFISVWPDVHVAALKRRFAEGLSFAQIAADINAEFGTAYSRNACIGKAARIGLEQVSRPKPPKEKREPTFYPRKPRPPKITPEEIIRCDEVVPLNLSLIELRADQCKWPYGDGPFLFCGRPVPHGSYCLAHHVLSRHDRQARPERPDFGRMARKATHSTSDVLARLSGIEEST